MGSSPTAHPTKNPLLLCNGGFFLWWGAQWDENRAAVHSTVSNQPSGLLLSPRVPTIRNVYRGPTLQLFLTADFFCVGAQWDSKSTALPQAGQQTAQWAVC